MKTWEIHKQIDENPKEMLEKRFKLVKGVLSGYENINVGDIAKVVTFGIGDIGLSTDWRIKGLTGFEDWEEVKKPISFMEAVEKLRDNPNLKISLSYEERGILAGSLPFDELLQYLGRDFYNATLVEMFLKGKWYIE